MDMKDVARFLRNQVASAATAALKLLQKSSSVKNPDKKKELEILFEEALSKHTHLESVSNLLNTIASWLQHDVLQLAGHPPIVRAMGLKWGSAPTPGIFTDVICAYRDERIRTT